MSVSQSVRMMFLFLILNFMNVSFASPTVEGRAVPIVTISSPSATIIGLPGSVEQFPGVPFAQPPVGKLRLKPPQSLASPLGTYLALTNKPACPQFISSNVPDLDGTIPTSALGLLTATPLFQTTIYASEDCLYLNIHRPAGTTANSKLPVLFWIFGGGFELGWNTMYDGSGWVQASINQGKPIIFVTVNYRVGGFGFLPGKEILADGSANLGLLDQRLGLKWIADNIAAFGGDPDKVTLWGESAGAISIFDQMVMYDGNHTYKGKPLFRGAIMNSGSAVPADPVDCPKSQLVYDTVVASAGCSSSSDTLACLRGVSYAKYLQAAASVPALLSYTSVSLSYLPRPDGTALTQSPELLAAAGKFARVPIIIGDQEDEGTLFALFQSNITTTAQLVTYLSTIFFHDATTDQISDLIATYPDPTINGSPFRTGSDNNWYPQFKLLAALLGDLTFTLVRRGMLQVLNAVAPDLPTYSYLSSYDYGTPILGTLHGGDILQVFFGILPNYAFEAFQTYYLSFINTLDPNDGTDTTQFAEWPKWSEGNQLVNMFANNSTLITDDFRQDTLDYLLPNIASFRI